MYVCRELGVCRLPWFLDKHEAEKAQFEHKIWFIKVILYLKIHFFCFTPNIILGYQNIEFSSISYLREFICESSQSFESEKTQQKWNMIKPKCSSKASCKAFQVRNFRSTMARAQQIWTYSQPFCVHEVRCWGVGSTSSHNVPFLAVVPQAPGATAKARGTRPLRLDLRRLEKTRQALVFALALMTAALASHSSAQRDISGEWLSKSPGADVSYRKPRRIHPCSESMHFFHGKLWPFASPTRCLRPCLCGKCWKNAKTKVANGGPKDHGSPKLRMWIHETEILCVLEMIGWTPLDHTLIRWLMAP